MLHVCGEEPPSVVDIVNPSTRLSMVVILRFEKSFPSITLFENLMFTSLIGRVRMLASDTLRLVLIVLTLQSFCQGNNPLWNVLRIDSY